MARDIVVVRQSGACCIITLTHPVLKALDIKVGDRVMVTVIGPTELKVTREED